MSELDSVSLLGECMRLLDEYKCYVLETTAKLNDWVKSADFFFQCTLKTELATNTSLSDGSCSLYHINRRSRRMHGWAALNTSGHSWAIHPQEFLGAPELMMAVVPPQLHSAHATRPQIMRCRDPEVEELLLATCLVPPWCAIDVIRSLQLCWVDQEYSELQN